VTGLRSDIEPCGARARQKGRAKKFGTSAIRRHTQHSNSRCCSQQVCRCWLLVRHQRLIGKARAIIQDRRFGIHVGTIESGRVYGAHLYWYGRNLKQLDIDQARSAATALDQLERHLTLLYFSLFREGLRF
jgi:hypothetical protein